MLTAPLASGDDEVFDNGMVAADCVPAAAVVEQLVVLLQVEHVEDRVVQTPEGQLVRIIVPTCKKIGF